MLNREQIFTTIQDQLDPAWEARERFAVMMVRVHGVRDVGLRFGYGHGEQALEKARLLIEQSLRPVDRVFVADAESFAVVLPGMRNRNHALLAATRLMNAFEQPIAGAPSPWRGRPIMGIALSPEHGANADLLCRRAEMAVDEAQRCGEHAAFYLLNDGQVEIFYDELRDAIETNRLHAYFQPTLHLGSGAITGAESLARWSSPRHGEVAPSDFVPFAEQSDLISALTRWSINTTLRHAAALRAVQGLSFAINLSPKVFARPGLVEQLIGALEIWDVAPTALVVEVTETALVNDLEQSVNVLHRLRDHGIRVSIDDFGTGYASIAYLRRFPATELKIDMSLVSAMMDDARTAKLVGAIINMAHHLDLTTVAEGIENQATQHLLTDMGCDFGQGFFLGRPEPASDFIARFAQPAPSP
ncbi:MAG: GGDEF domain-containing phosphodiesterase [Rhodanobacter sp.]|jgi:diguanylate cyclase (GGDEF)-like protein|nr:GGDEF domain-containing phosphodiesterase [Rhodanobacter sp.]